MAVARIKAVSRSDADTPRAARRSMMAGERSQTDSSAQGYRFYYPWFRELTYGRSLRGM